MWLGLAGALAWGCGSPSGGSAGGDTASSGATQGASGTKPTAAPPATSVEAPAASDMPPPADPNERRVNFNLEDAGGDELMLAVSNVVGRPLKVDADAKPYLHCAKVTIRAPDVITAREVVARTTLSLRPFGLLVTLTDKDLAITKAPDAPAKPCAKK